MVGRFRFLAVFYHVSEPLRNGTQQIGYKLIDAATNRVLASGAMSAISSRSSLVWAGFGNDSSLLVMDSSGMVSMLVCVGDAPSYSSWEWMPMLDTLGLKKSSDDSFWPVTVYDGKLVCVPLKGGTKYPDAAARRPVTAALGLKLPLARGTIAKRYAAHDVNDARQSPSPYIHRRWSCSVSPWKRYRLERGLLSARRRLCKCLLSEKAMKNLIENTKLCRHKL
jgi:Minichromosome loss protein, Mcl1, middle region